MANFLGKKISLISKAGIRYEGILYTIDQTAFTVALSKVKSFGTEDRTAERYIAARDEVYEYIIFRGSDISDLHVCENSLYTDDSAIVKIMSPNLTNPSSPPVMSSQLHGVNTDVNNADTPPHRHQEPSSPVAQPPITVSKRFMNFSKVNSRQDDHSHGNNQEQSNQRYTKPDHGYRDSEDLEEIAVKDYRQFQNRDQTMNKTDFYDQTGDDNRNYINFRRPNPRQRGFRGSGYVRGYSGNGGGSGGGRAFRTNKDAGVDSLKDDFDFESANALMEEELAHMHVGVHDGVRDDAEGDNVEEEDEEAVGDDCSAEKSFYDKKKSFFDSISSEVTDRGTVGTSDRRPRNNLETFGVSEYGRGGRGGGPGYRTNRWNGSRGAFRGNYGRGSSAGFIRRGGISQRGDSYGGRGQFPFQSNQRRHHLSTGFSQSN